jgi:hypothetical protein
MKPVLCNAVLVGSLSPLVPPSPSVLVLPGPRVDDDARGSRALVLDGFRRPHGRFLGNRFDRGLVVAERNQPTRRGNASGRFLGYVMRRTLTAALASALALVCAPAFADVAPPLEEKIETACFFAFAAGILAVAVFVLYRVRRRR